MFQKIAAFLSTMGTGVFLPTMAPDKTFIQAAVEEMQRLEPAERVPGLYVEGPFISLGKKGGILDKYIRGKELIREYKLTRPSIYTAPAIEQVEKDTEEAVRPSVPCLPAGKRINDFSEVNLNITEEEAVREARRCLRCDLETKDGEKAIKSQADLVR